MILACQNVSKAFGTDVILDEVSFHIEEHEKAAIVGANGAGKTTLLKIIVGQMQPDSGTVALSRGRTMGYLAQNQDLSSEETIYSFVRSVKKDLLALEDRLRTLEHQMRSAQGEELEQRMAEYNRIQEQFERSNGYSVSSEITGVLKGLGFSEDEFDRKVSTLSGGQKTRAALGRLLLAAPDVLLLAEDRQGPALVLVEESLQLLLRLRDEVPKAVLIVSDHHALLSGRLNHPPHFPV